MGTAEEDVREAKVKLLMNGSQEDRDRFIIMTLLDLNENGCKKACTPGLLEKWTPTGIATLISGVVIGVIEYFRK